MGITGYASSTSVAAGGTIDFHLSTDMPGNYTLYVRRVGIKADPGRPVEVTGLVAWPIRPQGYRDGFGWPAAYTFAVPDDLASGLYRLSTSSNPAAPADTNILAFVVRPRSPGAGSRVLLSVCFITPQAYNSAGGKSLYDTKDSPRASVVSFDRPSAPDGTLRESHEAALLKWLEEEQIAVEYCSNVDLHTNPGLLAAYDCLVIAGHDEYWSKEMRDQVDAFVSSGGNLVVLSGNSCYRQVRLDKGARSLVFHKYSGADPEPDRTRATVAFAQPPLSRPANATLGAGFTAGAEFAPGGSDGPKDTFILQFRDHWALRGAAAPGKFMHYETDAAEYVMEQALGMTYARATGTDGTPLSCTILGYADLRHWIGKPGMATMTVLQRGGTVFHGGSIEWAGALGKDAGLAQITRNVLARLRARRPPEWEDVGHANNVTAMTALDGRLYARTDGQLWRRYPVGGEANWTPLGFAEEVVALASASGKLFALTGKGKLRVGTVAGDKVAWADYGDGPAGAATLAAVGEMLYTLDGGGNLQALSLRGSASWQDVNPDKWKAPLKGITTLATCDDVLYARTGDGRLVRTNQDIIWESTGWTAVSPADDLRGMAVVDRLLFAATAANRLVRLDLNNLPVPAPAVAEEAPATIQVAGLEIAGAALVA
jgi:hypothetical protein